MFITLLMGILGTTSALQYSVEYKYNYTGIIAVGLPELKGQYGSTGIKCDVIIQVFSKSKAYVHFQNVKVGTPSNVDVDCNERDKIPLPWRHIPEAARQLEKPFLVRLAAEGKNVMQVEQGEEIWVTNIRKAIVSIFRLQPVISSDFIMKDSNHLLSFPPPLFPVFSVVEESLYGTCESEYVLTYLPPTLQVGMNLTLNNVSHVWNNQRTSNYRTDTREEAEMANTGDLYRLVRSVDFDRCHDLVALQHADILAKNCEIGSGRCHNLETRSMRGEYILRKGKLGFRIEKGVVEGTIFEAPYGFKSEYIQTISNQTVQLLSAIPISRKIETSKNMKSVDTWNYEVISPYKSSPLHYHKWVQYGHSHDRGENEPLLPELLVTGKTMTDAELVQAEEKLHKLMKSVVDGFQNMKQEGVQGRNMSLELHAAARLVNIFPYQQLEKAYNEIMNSEQEDERKNVMQSFFIDVMAASGSSSAIHILLKEIERGSYSISRSISIFMTLSSNTVSPASIVRIFEFIKTLDMKTRPALTSTAVINTATLIHHLCIDQPAKTRGIPEPILGIATCPTDTVVENFISFIKEKLSESPDLWIRIVYIQALTNLGSVKALEVLRPIALGITETNPRIRAVAIYGFNQRLLSSARHQKSHIFGLLESIHDNWSENSEVRQAALATMVSWDPPSLWWKDVALSTWRDPSRQMASFASSVIETVAFSETDLFGNVTVYAMHALPLAKPVPVNDRYSKDYMWSNFLFNLKSMTSADFGWMANTKSLFPKEIYALLYTNFGGYPTTAMEILSLADGLQNFINKLINVGEGRQPNGDRNAKVDINIQEIGRKIMHEIHNELGMVYKEQNSTQINIYLRFFNLMQEFVSTNKERLSHFDIANFCSTLMKGHDIYFSKYINPHDLTSFLPTDLGLPFIFMFSEPVVSLIRGHVKLELPNESVPSNLDDLLKLKNARLHLQLDSSLFTRMNSISKIGIPWETKAIGAGVDVLKEIVVPANYTLEMNNTFTKLNLTYAVSPTVPNKLTFGYAHNVPFTLVKNLYPVDMENLREAKPIRLFNEKEEFKVTNKIAPMFTGMNLEVDWRGDVQYPLTFQAFFDTLYSASHNLNKILKSPTVKYWKIALNYDPVASKNHEIVMRYAASMSNASAETQVGNSRLRAEKHLSFDHILQDLHGKSDEHGKKIYLFMMEFLGYEPRSYATSASFHTSYLTPKRMRQFVTLILAHSPVNGYDPRLENVCLRALVTKPKFSPLNTFDEIDSLDLTYEMDLDLCLNQHCSDSIFKGKVVLDQTTERREKIKGFIKDACDYIDFDKFLVYLRHSVYDKLMADMTWAENIPLKLVNATHKMEEFIFAKFYPYADVNRFEHNNPRRISVRGFRPSNSNKWELTALKPNMKIVFSKLPLPVVFTKVLPFGVTMYHKPHIYQKTSIGETTKCVIGKDMMRTFDGVKFPRSVKTSCWQVAAMMEGPGSEDQMEWVVETKEEGGKLQARIYAPKEGLEIILIPNQIKVNGETVVPKNGVLAVYDSVGTFYYEVVQENEKVLFNLPGHLEVTLKDDVEIKASQRYSGMVSGLCGDINTESFADLQGPSSCIYNNSALFEASWTLLNSSPEDCKDERIERLKQEVKKYEMKCPKSNSTLAGHREDIYRNAGRGFEGNCYDYLYSVRMMGHGKKTCVSQSPVRVCTQDCKSGAMRNDNVMYNCWDTSKVKSLVDTPVMPGYVNRRVTASGPEEASLVLEQPVACLK